jgi:hypothetical protein
MRAIRVERHEPDRDSLPNNSVTGGASKEVAALKTPVNAHIERKMPR